jgi:hypothetical protein
MKRGIIIAGTLLAGFAFAGTGSIVASFRSPCSYVYGIDYYGGYLYHTDGNIDGWIYKTTTTGALVESIKNITAARGIDRTQTEFWTCSYIPPRVYRLSTTGSILNSFPIEGTGYGITFGEEVLWYTQGTFVFKVTTNGSIMRSFAAPGLSVTGIFWDDPNLWLVNSNLRTFFLVNQNGSILDSVGAPKGRPYGITWDDSYLWYSTEDNRYVYKMKVSLTAIAPASLGKVKALYR